MDVNSLAHTKWNCKYHIVFAPKFRRKIIYGKQRYSKYTQYALQKKRGKNSGGRDVPRPCAYAGGDTAEHQYIKFHRIFKGKKYSYDIRKTCKVEI